mmetsp:Transcript_28004/g.66519  ORF Transcript_28004/g.66519 Transcript_28004/m.66519 type:complete len:354 (-) Transcript_28004:100-1161(-)
MSNWTGSLGGREEGWSCFSLVAPIFPSFSEAPAETTAPPEPLDIFVLAGQSNMAGRGGVVQTKNGLTWDGVVPAPCQPAPRKIFKFNSTGCWEEAVEPIHQDIDSTKVCGVGPGMPFANQLLSMGFTDRIGLVPCAIGGTRIDLWQEGGKLFTNMVHRTLTAIAERPNSRLRGLVWYQGESDADTKERAAAYKEKLAAFIDAARTALDSPSLPILQVLPTEACRCPCPTPDALPGTTLLLGRSPAMVTASAIAPQVAITSTRHEVPFVDDVREAQFGLKAPRMVTVDARGFHLPDGFHLSTYAQCKLGKEMAEVFASSFPPADPQQEMYAPSVDDMTLKEDNGSCAKEPKQSG